MYETLTFKQLKPGMYCIFVGQRHYYIGEFVSLGKAAQFKNIYATFPEGYVRMFQDQYFSENCVYRRDVSKEELKNAYRNAFERRALHQILSSLFNHPFLWY